MNFPIEIRHLESGLAKAFGSLEEIAHFLADKVEAEWEGWRHLGELPAVPAPEVAAEPVAESGGSATLVDALRSGLVTQEGDTLHFNRSEITETVVPVVANAAPVETVEVVITPEGAVHSDQIEGAKPMADLPAAGDAPQDPSA